MKDYKDYSTKELIIIANKMLDDLDTLLYKMDCDLLDIRENNKIAA